MATARRKKKIVRKKAKRKTTRRRVTRVASLDANDALRLAVSDKKFAQALIKNPERFKDAFRLSPSEIGAIKEGLGGGRGGLAADGYE